MVCHGGLCPAVADMGGGQSVQGLSAAVVPCFCCCSASHISLESRDVSGDWLSGQISTNTSVTSITAVAEVAVAGYSHENVSLFHTGCERYR